MWLPQDLLLLFVFFPKNALPLKTRTPHSRLAIPYHRYPAHCTTLKLCRTLTATPRSPSEANLTLLSWSMREETSLLASDTQEEVGQMER